MRLDATDLRYLSTDEFHVLKACETGSLSHEVVPSALIASTSGLHHSGLNKIMSELSRRALIARERNIKYDGWRLTYGGYDWLAVRAMREKNALFGVGTRVGVGKESDIYMAYRPPPSAEEQAPPAVLKVHRLGRISFRKIKEKRDYLGQRTSSPNWMYLSRLAAKKEWLFMQTLHQHGFPVPLPIYQSRHAILMSRINGYPLRQIVDLPAEHVASLFASLMALFVRLARAGLIHCDFNEFNIMIRQATKDGKDGEVDGEEEEEEEEDDIWARAKAHTHGDREDSDGESEYKLKAGEAIERGNGFERIYKLHQTGKEEEGEDSDEDEYEEEEEDESPDEEREFDADGTNEALRVQLKDGSSIEPILIDFPQMISVEHPNAEYYFDRDVEGVCSFFRRRFRFTSEDLPVFRDIVPLSRQHERTARAARRAKRAKAADSEDREGDLLVETPDEDKPLGLELDVLTQASGLGRTDKELSALDQYMAAMRVQTENGDGPKDEPDLAAEEESGEGSGAEEEEDNDEINARIQDGTLLPPSVIQPTGRGLARQSRQRKSDGMAPKRNAKNEHGAVKQDVESRIAAERQRRTRQDAKHHGKKSQSGKAGRAYASGGGSKAKTGDKALMDNSLQF